ncbi:iron-containing redox enzyme family protein [Streptomyces sp. NRRL S-87]|uniref:iron-containing redox enzyme family protein n=1 Tax=Streptomyces sp. NRRL S-87 TaxID=1463920 RepID=UPI00068A1B86|nr:iron-containing redox enzyme family protein [Streptomyces sp. NRRL S-87]
MDVETPVRAPAAATAGLPRGRGALSGAVRTALLAGEPRELPGEAEVAAADPYGEDLQLALHLCYEPHYRGFPGVADAAEWDPGLLGFRLLLERRFLDALRADVRAEDRVDRALREILSEPADAYGVSHYLRDEGGPTQLREYAALRSVHQLRESDPYAWVLPRLRGRAKAGMAAVLYDEFGGGRAERVHAELWAGLMTDLGLDPSYGRYVPAAGAATLAAANLMSLFGLHRSLRGALVGHVATVEVTSSPAAARMVVALRRAGAGPAALLFYEEHVEADAVHEQLVRREVVGGLLAEEPELEADVAFGIAATVQLAEWEADRLLTAWRSGRSALRVPLEE